MPILRNLRLALENYVNSVYKVNVVYGDAMEPASDIKISPRERRRAERLDAIREAALELVIEGGVDGFSVHKLAERLGLTVGALYRYFDSVDHILIAVQVDVLEAFDAYLSRVERSLETTSGLQRVWGLAQAYVGWAEHQPERFKLISRLVSTPDPLFSDTAATRTVAPTLDLLGRLAEALDAAVADGDLNEGLSLPRAVILWSSIHGLIERRKLSRLQPDLFAFEAMFTDLVGALLVGWGATRARVQGTVDIHQDLRFFARHLNA